MPSARLDAPGDGREAASAGSAALHTRSRRALKNWRVRSRLVLLVAIPTLTAIVLGGIRIGSSAQSAIAYQQVEQLAKLSGKVTGLAQALEAERNATVTYIVLGPTGGGRGSSTLATSLEPQVLNQAYAVTNSWAAQVKRQAAGIGGTYPAQVRQEAQGAVTAIEGLPDLRRAARFTQIPSLVVIQEYTDTINAVLALNNEVALGSNDAALASSVRSLDTPNEVQ